MVKKRRRRSAACKFRVALEALQSSKTISQLSREHEVHPNLIRAWKRQLQEDGPQVFTNNGERKQREKEAQEANLHEQIGRLKKARGWLKSSSCSDGGRTDPPECTLFSPPCVVQRLRLTVLGYPVQLACWQ